MTSRFWNERTLDLRLLEIFSAVYEERSFSRAAARLYLTQPTVSGHIKTLERQLGVRLFDRLGREIRPTAVGDVLYEYARGLPELRRAIAERLSRVLGRLEGELRLGASTIPGEYVLPEVLERFRREHPHVRATVIIADTERIIDEVEHGRVDVGFVGARRERRDVDFQAFATDRVILVAPWRWKRMKALSLAELRELPLLIRERGSGTRAVLERALSEVGYRLSDFTIAAELGSTSALKHAVIAGMGLAFLSTRAVEHELRCRLLRAVSLRELPAIEREFFIARHRRRALSPLGETFLTFLLDAHPRATSSGGEPDFETLRRG